MLSSFVVFFSSCLSWAGIFDVTLQEMESVKESNRLDPYQCLLHE